MSQTGGEKMGWVIVLMSLPIYMVTYLLRSQDPWDKLLAFSSFSTKVGVMAVLLGTVMGYEFILSVAVVYMLVGGASIMLLAHFMSGRKGE